jgi:hypothetical protein
LNEDDDSFVLLLFGFVLLPFALFVLIDLFKMVAMPRTSIKKQYPAVLPLHRFGGVRAGGC